MALTLGSGEDTYTWHEHWATLPDSLSVKENGRTHAMAVIPDGRVVVFMQADPSVVFFDAEGHQVGAWGERFSGAHGLTLVEHDGQPAFWLTDQKSKEVVKTTLDGEALQNLEAPPENHRPDGKYVPTWADQDPATGDIWVADGYGGSAIHRYASDGNYKSTILGDEESMRFNCPHGLRFGPDGNLYIADRGNRRIAVYDNDGKFIKANNEVTHSPCMFDFHNGLILVPELMTGVKVLDMKLNVVAELGANPAVVDEPRPEGWPNLAGTEHVQPGKFNSPHGGCFGPDDSIYVAEWIVGGRITKLEKN
jgi:hypothetical protein